MLDMDTVHQWCASKNAFGEKYAHCVHKLVIDPALLSEKK
jgi:hypothetical protein